MRSGPARANSEILLQKNKTKFKSRSNLGAVGHSKEPQYSYERSTAHLEQVHTSSGWFGRPHFLHGSSSSGRTASSLSFPCSSSEAAEDFSLSDPSLSSLLEYFHRPRVREPVHRTLPLGFTLQKRWDNWTWEFLSPNYVSLGEYLANTERKDENCYNLVTSSIYY